MTGSYRNMHFPRHSHVTYAFGVVEYGALGFRYRGESCVATAGTINLVVPGEVHDGHPACDEGWRYRMAYVDPESVRKVAEEVWGGDRGLPFISQGVLDSPDLARILRRIHSGLDEGFLDDISASSLWLYFLGELVGRFGEYSTASSPRGVSVKKTCDFMRENLGKNLSLQELADISGLSRWHFIRVFREATGLTPHMYLVQMRVRRAENLLRSGLGAADAAFEVGFSDQSHLTRWFKSIVGITPVAFKKGLSS